MQDLIQSNVTIFINCRQGTEFQNLILGLLSREHIMCVQVFFQT